MPETNNNSWSEWSKWVIKELERLNLYLEKLESKVIEIDKILYALNGKTNDINIKIEEFKKEFIGLKEEIREFNEKILKIENVTVPAAEDAKKLSYKLEKKYIYYAGAAGVVFFLLSAFLGPIVAHFVENVILPLIFISF